MTYLQWLQRYVELAIGEGDSTADTSSPHSPWLDITWRDRFAEMLQRAEARLHPQDFGPIETLFADEQLLEQPSGAIAALTQRYPDAETIKLHPADVPFFVTLCKTLGKPVNFVPVIDKDVRRWWRSDSLWQAHDARYAADQVCIIPGTASVAGITRVDEPVGDLLDRSNKRQSARCWRLASSLRQSPRAGGAVPTSPARWQSCWTLRTCCGPGAPRPTRCTALPTRRNGRSTKTGAPHTLPPAPGWKPRPTARSCSAFRCRAPGSRFGSP
jgi:enoyl reductase-like protein